jgi:hypothetical protein
LQPAASSSQVQLAESQALLAECNQALQAEKDKARTHASHYAYLVRCFNELDRDLNHEQVGSCSKQTLRHIRQGSFP